MRFRYTCYPRLLFPREMEPIRVPHVIRLTRIQETE